MTKTRPSPLTLIVISLLLALIGFTTAGRLARADHPVPPGPEAAFHAPNIGPESYAQRPLTEAGCCPSFNWSTDSNRVRFLDSVDEQTGWWSVDAEDAELQFDSDLVGYESPSGRYLTIPEGTAGDVRVLDLITGESNLLPNVGGRILFSPAESQIVFSIRDPGFGAPWTRSATIYLADADGANRRSLVRAVGTVVAWFPDGQRLLLSARRSSTLKRGLWELSTDDGSLRPLLALTYFRAVELSPDGRYISYVRTPEPNTDLAGLWILDTLTLTAKKMKLSGSYAWHPSSRGLVVIPPRAPTEDYHQLWWLDVEEDPPIPLADPTLVPLAISNFEWELSPDGRKIAYRAARHLAVWVLDFGLAFDFLLPDLPSPNTLSVK